MMPIAVAADNRDDFVEQPPTSSQMNFTTNSLFGGESDMFDSGFVDLSIFPSDSRHGFDLYRARGDSDIFGSAGKNVYSSHHYTPTTEEARQRSLMEDSAPIFGGARPSYEEPIVASAALSQQGPDQVMVDAENLNAACCADDSASADSSLITDELLESSDNEVYVPQTVQVDGRKREAKRLKSRTKIAQEELELEKLVRDYQGSNRKIIALEDELNDLKNQKISKRELQSQRNRLTAQISRDRQKLEMNFLKAKVVNYLRLLKRLERKVKPTEESKQMCKPCGNWLKQTVKAHRQNILTEKVATSGDDEDTYDSFEPSAKRQRTDDSHSTTHNNSSASRDRDKKPTAPDKLRVSKKAARLIKGATAVVGGLGLMAANQAGQPTSQALVQVRDDFMPPAELPRFGGNNHFSLEDTYMSYDMRDSYLQRQALPCHTKADSIIISKEDYETRSFNVWRQADDLYAWPPVHQAESQALDFFTVDASKSFSDKVSFEVDFNTIM